MKETGFEEIRDEYQAMIRTITASAKDAGWFPGELKGMVKDVTRNLLRPFSSMNLRNLHEVTRGWRSHEALTWLKKWTTREEDRLAYQESGPVQLDIEEIMIEIAEELVAEIDNKKQKGRACVPRLREEYR